MYILASDMSVCWLKDLCCSAGSVERKTDHCHVKEHLHTALFTCPRCIWEHTETTKDICIPQQICCLRIFNGLIYRCFVRMNLSQEFFCFTLSLRANLDKINWFLFRMIVFKSFFVCIWQDGINVCCPTQRLTCQKKWNTHEAMMFVLFKWKAILSQFQKSPKITPQYT